MKDIIWTKSVREKIVGILWLITGFLSKLANNPFWVNWIFFTLGIVDIVFFIKHDIDSNK